MLAVAALPLALLAQFGPIQPKTYASPAGTWSLQVEPHVRDGASGAEYTLTHGEHEAWRAPHPFTLWDAIVDDDGRVAGYCLTGSPVMGGGTLHVVVLSPAGEVLLHEETERTDSRYLHGAPQPYATGLFAVPDLGRVVVRVCDDDWNALGEQWWAYELATGKVLYRERPRQKLVHGEPLVHVYAARAIPGTPLLLVQWRRWVRTKPEEVGVEFQLVDPDWNVVWSLTRPHDYEVPGDEEAEGRIAEEMRERGAVLAVAERRFELRLVAENAHVTFEVERKGGGWGVREPARRPYEPEAAVEIPTRALALRKRVPLVAPPPAGVEVRDVLALGFDERSRPRFVRREGVEGDVSLVQLDEHGAVVRTTPVRGFRSGSEWFALPEGHWWATPPHTAADRAVPASLVSEADGRAIEIPGLRVGSASRVVSLGKDAFVLLGSWRTIEGWSHGVLVCGFDGQVRWSETDSGHDVAVTTDGRVLVLVGEHGLRVYSATGERRGTTDLAAAWGREPTGPRRIAADGDGGVLVYDCEGAPPLYRMDRDLTVLTRFDVTGTGGPALEELRRNTRVAPDGSLWTMDTRTIVRLDASGKVELELGRADRGDDLDEAGHVEIESHLGRVLVQDRRTRAVHVFDGEGRRLVLCRPSPEHREELEHPRSMALAPDGSVYATSYTANGLHESMLRLTSDAGSEQFVARSLSEVTFTSSGERLDVRRDSIERQSAERTPLARLEKRPDGAWFRTILDLALAADGAFAVLDATPGPLGPDPRDRFVSLFDPRGEPLRALAVPAGLDAHAIAYQAGRILLADWERAWLMDARDGSLTALSLPEPVYLFGLAPDGRELWAVAADSRSLLRYALDP